MSVYYSCRIYLLKQTASSNSFRQQVKAEEKLYLITSFIFLPNLIVCVGVGVKRFLAKSEACVNNAIFNELNFRSRFTIC